jgi:hypothetical protein
MPVWRCPHCATPQAEASRCWVCHRSTTSCVTCRHYRRGISGGLGLCGLDPRHPAVADTDVMACWVGARTAAEDPKGGERPGTGRREAPGERAPRTFVPVEELMAARAPTAVAVLERSDAHPGATPAVDPVPVMASPPPARPIPGRWWLWGDPDPWPERVGERWT